MKLLSSFVLLVSFFLKVETDHRGHMRDSLDRRTDGETFFQKREDEKKRRMICRISRESRAIHNTISTVHPVLCMVPLQERTVSLHPDHAWQYEFGWWRKVDPVKLMTL